jgi:hypothetical protein
MLYTNDLVARRVVIFVEYEITAVPEQETDAFSRYLLDEVWGESGRVDEHVILTNRDWSSRGEKDVVRYQFGDLQEAEHRMDEIAELVKSALERWDSYKHRYFEK